MKYEDKKTLVVSILMIAVLGFFSYRNFINLKNIEKTSPPSKETPNANIPSLPSLPPLPSLEEIMSTDIDDLMRKHDTTKEVAEPEKIKYSSYSIPEVALIEYPSHWKKLGVDMRTPYENMLDILFIVHSQDIAQPTIIAVSEIKAYNIEESMGIVEEIFRREGATVSFIEKTEIENGLYLEAKYEYGNGQTMKSKEKLLKINDKFYLFSVVAHAEKFEDRSPQMEHIINSIQIIK